MTDELLRYRLVEPYDPTDPVVGRGQRLRVTPSGRIHNELVFSEQDTSYLIQMALTTPCFSEDFVTETRRRLAGPKLEWRDWLELLRDFAVLCLDEDQRYVTIPEDDAYRSQRELRERFSARWVRQDSFSEGDRGWVVADEIARNSGRARRGRGASDHRRMPRG